MDQVEHFGAHWDGSIGWLQQGRGSTNFLGLPKSSPFRNPKTECNHLFPVAAPIPDKVHWEAMMRIKDDPLFQAMLPVPREMDDRAFYLEDPYDDLNLYIASLSRLSSPIHSVLKPAWMIKGKELERQMTATNVQTWVITQMDRKHVELLSAINNSTNYLPRTVLITGAADVPVPSKIKKITTKIRDTELSDLMTLPFEILGATLLRRYMRKEGLFDPIESRKDRRTRLQKEYNNPT